MRRCILIFRQEAIDPPHKKQKEKKKKKKKKIKKIKKWRRNENEAFLILLILTSLSNLSIVKRGWLELFDTFVIFILASMLACLNKLHVRLFYDSS